MYPSWPAVCIWDETSTPEGNRPMLSERTGVSLDQAVAELAELEPAYRAALQQAHVAYVCQKKAMRTGFLRERAVQRLIVEKLKLEQARAVPFAAAHAATEAGEEIDADFEVMAPVPD